MRGWTISMVALGSCALAGGAHGEDAPAAARPAVSANVALATDYVFRGVSQTSDGPALQAGADLTWGAAYAGGWASNVDFGGGEHAEVDLYAGARRTIAGWTVDLGAIAYLYPGQPGGADEDYIEARLGASRTFERLSASVAVLWSPDFFGPEQAATYVQADVALKLTDRLTASAALGRQWVSSDADYATWNAGAAFALTDRFTLDLRYHDTGAHRLGDPYEARVVAALKATF